MTEWISVNERLPEFGRHLVYWRPIDHAKRPFHREITVAEFTPYGPVDFFSLQEPKYWWSASGVYWDTETHITHWMPLPKAPD